MSPRIACFLCLLGIAVSAWSAETDSTRNVTIGHTDNTVPHVADGAGWQTTIVLTNLISTPVYYGIEFKSDGGAAQEFDLASIGKTSGFIGQIGVGATGYIPTTGTSSTLTQGYAHIYFYDRSPQDPAARLVDATAGGFAIFRRRLAGQADQEAVVPISNTFEQRFTIVFDNRNGFFSGVAIVNDTTLTGELIVTARDNAGNLLLTDLEVLGPGAKRTYLVKDRFTALADKAGTLTYFINTAGLSGLGLRFNPQGSFTSTYPLRY